MTKDKALKLALEALINTDTEPLGASWRRETEAIAAIKKALAQPEIQSTHSADCYKWHHQCAIAEVERLRAQPEQEPVAWIVDVGEMQLSWNQPTYSKAIPLYTTPPQRKPLTDEDLETMAEKYVTNCYFDTLKYARAIEAAHGIKETE